MIKKIQMILVTSIILIGISIIKPCDVYAMDVYTNAKVDTLIENDKLQEEIKNQIIDLEKELEIKKQSNESEDIEVVKISFIENTSAGNVEYKNLIDSDINNIENQVRNLEKELELKMIEGIQTQKVLEESIKKYLEEENLEFLPISWPVPSHNEISSPFGERIHPITKLQNFHTGIDIPAPQDEDIIAVDDGRVIFSGMQNGYGNVVKIQHFDGKVTVYAHNNYNKVEVGDIVKKGQVIAAIGTTGNSTGNHLHFETIVSGKNINPMNTLKKED